MKNNSHAVPLPKSLRRITKRSFAVRALILIIYYTIISYYLIAINNIIGRFISTPNYISRMVLLLVILYIPPLFFSKILWYIKDKDFEGEVLEIRYERKLKPSAGLSVPSVPTSAYALLKSQSTIAVIAKVRLASGREKWFEMRRYETDDPCVNNLRIGNDVRHYKWCKYTQILDGDFRHDVDCIFCGMYTDKREDYCKKCGKLLIKDNRIYKADDRSI